MEAIDAAAERAAATLRARDGPADGAGAAGQGPPPADGRPGSGGGAGSGWPPLAPPSVPPGLVEAIVELERRHAAVAAADAGALRWRGAESLSERQASFAPLSRACAEYRGAVVDAVARVRRWQGLPASPAWDQDQPAHAVAEEAADAVRAASASDAAAHPFLWRGRRLLAWVAGSLDFLADVPRLQSWLGREFPLRRNPLSLPTPLDARPPPLRATVRRVRVAGSDEMRMDAALLAARAASSRLRADWWSSFRTGPVAATADDVIDRVEEEAMRELAERGDAQAASAAVVDGRYGALGPCARREQERLSRDLARAGGVAGRFGASRRAADAAAAAIDEATGEARQPWSTDASTAAHRSNFTPVRDALVAAGRVGAPGGADAASRKQRAPRGGWDGAPGLRPVAGARPGTPDIPLTEAGGTQAARPRSGPRLPPSGMSAVVLAAITGQAARDARDGASPGARLRAAAQAVVRGALGQSGASVDAEKAWAQRAVAAAGEAAGTAFLTDGGDDEPLAAVTPRADDRPGAPRGMPGWWPSAGMTKGAIAVARACEACLLDAEILGV